MYPSVEIKKKEIFFKNNIQRLKNINLNKYENG